MPQGGRLQSHAHRYARLQELRSSLKGSIPKAFRPMAAACVCRSGAPGEGRAGHGHPHLWGSSPGSLALGCDPRSTLHQGKRAIKSASSSCKFPFPVSLTMSALLLCTELLGWDNGHEGHPAFLSKLQYASNNCIYLFCLFS